MNLIKRKRLHVLGMENESKQATKSILELLNNPNVDAKPVANPIEAKKEDVVFTLGSKDLLGESAPRRNRREKQREKSQDGFSGFDLSEMLGLDNTQGKKPDSRQMSNNENVSILKGLAINDAVNPPASNNMGQGVKTTAANVSEDDIPAFMQTPSNHGSAKRRNRGGPTQSSAPAAADKLGTIGSFSPTKLDGNLGAHTAYKDKSSLLDLLDQVISNNNNPEVTNTSAIKKDSGKKVNILDILDSKHTGNKKELELADSLSSIALISDSDEEEESYRRSQGFLGQPKEVVIKPKAEAVNQKIGTSTSNQAQAETIKKLTEDLQSATKNRDSEKSQREKLALENESLLSKIDKVSQEHNTQIQQLKSLHQQELSALVSTSDATKKLNALVAQVEGTTQMVSNLQSQLDVTNDESLRAREKAVEIKEVHLSRMQEELRNESKSLQEERKRVETYLLELQESIKVSAIKEAHALEAIGKESSKLKLEIERFEKDKDSWQFNLNQVKSTYMMDVEMWKVQKENAQQEINKQKKEIAITKASLEANEKTSIVRDQEFNQRIEAERQQFDIEYKVFESERNDLLQKLKVLHRDEAYIKTEKLKLEEKQREIETMSKVFEKDEKDLEFKYASISNMRDDAVVERNRAEKLQEEIISLKRELQETQIACQREIMNLKDTKSEFVRQRVEKAKNFQANSIQAAIETIVPDYSANIPEETIVQSTGQRPRSTFRIDPLDERYRHKEPRSTSWTIEEKELAGKLEKALDRQIRKFKNSNVDRVISRQERILINAR